MVVGGPGTGSINRKEAGGMPFGPWGPNRTARVAHRLVSVPWRRVCILARAQHFPEQWVPHLGTADQTRPPGCPCVTGPSVRPPGDPGCLDCQLQISVSSSSGRWESGEGADRGLSELDYSAPLFNSVHIY